MTRRQRRHSKRFGSRPSILSRGLKRLSDLKTRISNKIKRPFNNTSKQMPVWSGPYNPIRPGPYNPTRPTYTRSHSPPPSPRRHYPPQRNRINSLDLY